MKFENKIKKLGIQEEVQKILEECELYNPATDKVYIQELSKMRKWEIMEVVGNYLDTEKLDFNVKFKTFLKTYEITEDEVGYYYALGVAEGGFALAYNVNDDIILIIEDSL